MREARQGRAVRSAPVMKPNTIELVEKLPAGAVLTEEGVLVVERGDSPSETAERIRQALETLLLG
jgi:hypothetical protein